MDVTIKIHSNPKLCYSTADDLEHFYVASQTMTIETLDEGKGDILKIMIDDKDIYVDWHELADAVDMIGTVRQGWLDRGERP